MANATPDYSSLYQPLAQDSPEYQQFVASPELKSRRSVQVSERELAAAFDPRPQDTGARGFASLGVPGQDPMAGVDTTLSTILKRAGSREKAMALLAEAEAEVNHNAEHALNGIGPIITQMTEQARANGQTVNISEMSDEDLAGLAQKAGLDPAISNGILSSGRNPLRGKGIDLASTIRERAIRYDSMYVAGKKVAENLQDNLFSLDNPAAKAQQYRNLSYFRSVQNNRFFKDAAWGIMTLGASAMDTAGNIVGGGVEAAIGHPMVAEAISPSIAQDRALRTEVQQTLVKAAEKAKGLGELSRARLAAAKTQEQKDSVGLEVAREFASDREVVELTRRLDEYRAKGYLTEGSRFSRIYSVFDGAVKAVPELWNFAAASTDPNGLFFQMETYASGNTMMGGMGGWMEGLNQWAKGTSRFKTMSDAAVLREVDVLQENWNTTSRQRGLGGVEMLYRAAGNDDAANLAASLTSVQTSEKASMVLDPIMLATGAVAGVAKVAKAATGVSAVARTAEATALLTKGEAIAARVVPKGAGIESATKSIINVAKAAGVELTETQAVALALTDAAASPELQKVLAATSAEVGQIKKAVGGAAAGDAAIQAEIKAYLAEAKAYADNAPKVPPIGKPAPVAAVAATGVGYTTEKMGRALEILSGMMGGAVDAQRLPVAVRRYIQIAKRIPGGTTTVAAGAGAIGGAIYGGPQGAAAGIISATIGGFALPALLAVGSPVGRALARNGKILKQSAVEIATGERQGTSLLLETGRRLREESIAARKAGDMKRASQLLADSNTVLRAQRKGLERAMGGTVSLAWEGAVGASVGSFLAYANDSNAVGAGAGIGFGGAMIARAAAMVHSLTPSGSELNRRAGVVADTLTILSRKDLEHRARFGEALASLGNDAAKVERYLENYRLLDMATGGNILFLDPTEMRAATVSLAAGEINVDAIRKMASERYPNEPQLAAAYAEDLLKRANEDATRRLGVTALNDRMARSKKDLDVVEKKLLVQQDALTKVKTDAGRAKIEAEISSLEAQREVLRLEQEKYAGEIDVAKASLIDEKAIVAEADRMGLQGEERAAFIRERSMRALDEKDPVRGYQVRYQMNGSSVQQVADGVYVNDSGQVLIDYKNADALVLGHEAFEALLMHDSTQALMPQMVNMMFGDNPRVSAQVTQAFFDAYASELTPKQAQAYKDGLRQAMDAHKSSGGKDIARLLPYTREAMAWWLAHIHDRRPIGYARGLATPDGMSASEARGRVPYTPGQIWKRLMGDASWTDNLSTTALRQEFAAMFDPDVGLLGERSRGVIRARLESNGMTFEASPDGTVRGFFRMDGTVRSPVMNVLYDSVLGMMGGKNAARRMGGFNPFDPAIPEGQRVAWVKASGMDWLLGPDGNTILPPEKVGAVVDAAGTAIKDALANVPPADRGLSVSMGKDGTVTYTGRPTQAEVDAVVNAPNVPKTMKDNLRAALQGLVNGQSNQVLAGRYINVRTTQKGVGTEERLVVGRDVGRVEGEKHIVPYAIVIGSSTNVPGGGKVANPITAVRVKAMDIGAVKGNRNIAFERGLMGKDGNVMRDSLGNEMSAAALRDLFPDETAFWNTTKLYIDHLASAGEIDAAALVAQMPAGMEPTAVKLAKLNGVSLETATRQRDAVRAILGLEAKKGRVTINPASKDRIMRDMNQTTTDFRLDGLGQLSMTGEQWNINSSVITWSQFNMAPATWRPVSDAAAKAVAASDGAWFTEEVLAHPTQPYIITRDTQDGQVRWRAFDRQTGDLIVVDGKKKGDAILAVRQHMASKEWLSEALEVTETVGNKADNSPEAAALRAEGREVSAALREDAKALDIRSKNLARAVTAALERLEKEAKAAAEAEAAAIAKGDTISARQERERVAERAATRQQGERLVADIEQRGLEAERRGERANAETERVLAAEREGQKKFAAQLEADLNAVQGAMTSSTDSAAMGVVRIDEIIQRAGLQGDIFAIAGKPDRQTLARKVLVFQKRPLGAPFVQKDLAAALRANLGNVASYYLGHMGISADLKSAQNYILANEAGWTLHSHLKGLKSGSVGRVFTVYNPVKQQVLETQEMSEAVRFIWLDSLREEVRANRPLTREEQEAREKAATERTRAAGFERPFRPLPR